MRNIFFDGYGELRWAWIVVLIIVAVLGFLFLILGLSAGITAGTEYAKCSTLESMDGANLYDWSLWAGCRIQTQSGFFVDVDSPSVYELIHVAP